MSQQSPGFVGRNRIALVVVAVVALGAVGVGVWAFTRGDDQDGLQPAFAPSQPTQLMQPTQPTAMQPVQPAPSAPAQATPDDMAYLVALHEQNRAFLQQAEADEGRARDRNERGCLEECADEMDCRAHFARARDRAIDTIGNSMGEADALRGGGIGVECTPAIRALAVAIETISRTTHTETGARLHMPMSCVLQALSVRGHLPDTLAAARVACPTRSGGAATGSGGAAVGGAAPESPSRTDVLQAMNAVRTDVINCIEDPGGSFNATITFASNGTVTSATMGPGIDGTPFGDCIVRAIRRAVVPAFTNPSFTVSFPFTAPR